MRSPERARSYAETEDVKDHWARSVSVRRSLGLDWSEEASRAMNMNAILDYSQFFPGLLQSLNCLIKIGLV